MFKKTADLAEVGSPYRLISPRILNPLGGWKKVLKTIIFWRLPLFRSVVLRLGTFRSHDPKRYGEL